jgi:hypothetical protein
MAIAASGCAPRQPFYFFEDGDLSHYVGAVQKIEYPDTCQDPLDEAAGTVEPLTLSNANFEEIWEVTLEDAIRTCPRKWQGSPEPWRKVQQFWRPTTPDG